MPPRIQSLVLKAKDHNQVLWDRNALTDWLVRLTGEQVNVEVLDAEKKCFKVILCTTDDKMEAYQKLLERHFWMN